MELHDELQVKAFEDYLKENRVCESCKHGLTDHAKGDDGYALPCCHPGCNCHSFEDLISREAAKKLTAGRFSKAPAGWMR